MENTYDIIIIGGGPGGYTAAIYCSRAGFRVLVIEKFSPGGQMTQTSQIENYPGFEDGVDGFELGFKMQKGAERFGAKTLRSEVTKVELNGEIKKVQTPDGEFLAKSVIIATGADHKHLGLESEEKLIGKGVAYCGACDGMFYRGKTVAVVGGGNSAAADALLLSKICQKVILVHRRDTLRAERAYHNPLMKAENVEFVLNSTVSEILSENTVTGIRVRNVLTAEETEVSVNGVFISIGRTPNTALFKGQIDMDEHGYILADETTKTNIKGIFAVGDVRTKPVRQIVTAVGDGATAAHYAEEYLANL